MRNKATKIDKFQEVKNIIVSTINSKMKSKEITDRSQFSKVVEDVCIENNYKGNEYSLMISLGIA